MMDSVDKFIEGPSSQLNELTIDETLLELGGFNERIPSLADLCDVPMSVGQKDQSSSSSPTRRKTVSLDPDFILDAIERIVTKTMSKGIRELQACLREELRAHSLSETKEVSSLFPTPQLPGHPHMTRTGHTSTPSIAATATVPETPAGVAESRRDLLPSVAEDLALSESRNAPARSSVARKSEGSFGFDRFPSVPESSESLGLERLLSMAERISESRSSPARSSVARKSEGGYSNGRSNPKYSSSTSSSIIRNRASMRVSSKESAHSDNVDVVNSENSVDATSTSKSRHRRSGSCSVTTFDVRLKRFGVHNVMPEIKTASDLGSGSLLTANSGISQVFHRRSRHFVMDTRFECFVCIAIVFNAILAGVATDYEARNLGQETPYWLTVCDNFFVAIFSLELALRLYVYRSSFFYKTGWAWNIFDFILVILQLLEISSIIGYIASSEAFVFARLEKLIRLIRILRLIRAVKIIQDLRFLVSSIIVSVRALIWAIALMVFLVYTFGVYITEMVSDVRRNTIIEDDDDQRKLLTTYYGTLNNTMLIMFQSITGGVDWAMNLAPLIKASSWAAVAFTLYVSFAVLAMLNVVTGVFIENVLNSTKRHTNTCMINNARELFQSLDSYEQSCMTWEIFESKLQATQMIEFFKAIDVDLSEAKPLFQLLDIEGNGIITAEDFLNGAFRLRGNAKALDLALLIHEVRQIKRCVSAGTYPYNVEDEDGEEEYPGE